MSAFARERRALRMVRLRPRQFLAGSAAWTVFFLYPLLPGWLLQRAYHQLQDHGADARFMWCAAGLVAAQLAMSAIIAVGHAWYASSFEGIESLVRGNVLYAMLVSGGDESGPRNVSSGDVVTRLRDDPKDMLMLIDNWIDVFGSVGFGVVAMALLARIDVVAALVMLVPLVLFGLANRAAGNRMRRVRAAARDATSDATDFLNAAFGSALTVKVTGAHRGVLQRVDRLNARRSSTMVADQTWADALWAVNGSVGDLCIGAALVVAARRLGDAGDVALFAAYAMNLIWLPQKIGGALVGRRRFDVAAARVDHLLPAPGAPGADGRQVDPAMVARPLPILGGPAAPGVVREERVALQTLEVRELSVAERGLERVSFTLQRGTLTVVSGPVGSGKTSLLRALIGLLPADSGEVLWNGAPVHDRAAFFVPPHCAFVSQVPHLFSDTLLDNLLLGASADPARAIRMAAFDEDVAGLQHGLRTPIGAGGVRLSGGQAQRAAAARALVHDAELVVLDDLTSALDVDTELLLWERLAASGRTVLAVSNRPVAIERADQHLAFGRTVRR